MRKFTFLILVAALASSSFAAKRPYVGGSTTQKSYSSNSKTASPKPSESEKKLAQDENFDLKKMSARLKNEAKK